MPAKPRFHVDGALHIDATLTLPKTAARHAQVLRLQPGDPITLFASPACVDAGEYEAVIVQMGRQDVSVRVLRHMAVTREATRQLTLAIGMPANERMDWLVEKATELGVAAIQPLMTERAVVRLDAARAERKTQHWRGIAVAACEQCGRNRVPVLHDAQPFAQWLAASNTDGPSDGHHPRFVLSFADGARPLAECAPRPAAQPQAATLLIGPEGGLSSREEEAALSQGFIPVTLGPRTLRAETAALAALVLLAD